MPASRHGGNSKRRRSVELPLQPHSSNPRNSHEPEAPPDPLARTVIETIVDGDSYSGSFGAAATRWIALAAVICEAVRGLRGVQRAAERTDCGDMRAAVDSASDLAEVEKSLEGHFRLAWYAAGTAVLRQLGGRSVACERTIRAKHGE